MSDAITENWQFLVGDFIARTYPQGITIAYDQMGQTPWYAGLDKNVIDTAGLTYRATAFPSFNETLEQRSSVYLSYREWSERLLGVFGSQPYRRWTRTQAVDHVFELEPHLIILNSIHVFKTHPDGAIETVSSHVPGLIAQDGRLKQRYVERKKWFLRFYERNDLSATIDWSKENPDSPAKADKMIVRVVDE